MLSVLNRKNLASMFKIMISSDGIVLSSDLLASQSFHFPCTCIFLFSFVEMLLRSFLLKQLMLIIFKMFRAVIDLGYTF
jgi:hypothetical protein